MYQYRLVERMVIAGVNGYAKHQRTLGVYTTRERAINSVIADYGYSFYGDSRYRYSLSNRVRSWFDRRQRCVAGAVSIPVATVFDDGETSVAIDLIAVKRRK